MGNKFCVEEQVLQKVRQSKILRILRIFGSAEDGPCLTCLFTLKILKEFLAKQNVSLFFLDSNHEIQSLLCEKSSRFILTDDSFRMWWRMRTVVGEKEVEGTASRLNFYPADCASEEREEDEVWHFGELSRTQAEELLSHSANDQGAFMVRFSNKHKKLGNDPTTARQMFVKTVFSFVRENVQ